mgnify:CR=1 FL=1
MKEVRQRYSTCDIKCLATAFTSCSFEGLGPNSHCTTFILVQKRVLQNTRRDSSLHGLRKCELTRWKCLQYLWSDSISSLLKSIFCTHVTRAYTGLDCLLLRCYSTIELEILNKSTSRDSRLASFNWFLLPPLDGTQGLGNRTLCRKDLPKSSVCNRIKLRFVQCMKHCEDILAGKQNLGSLVYKFV